MDIPKVCSFVWLFFIFFPNWLPFLSRIPGVQREIFVFLFKMVMNRNPMRFSLEIQEKGNKQMKPY